MKKKGEKISQRGLLIEYFQNNPNKDIPHNLSVGWAIKEFPKRTGRVFADSDRGIRKLHQEGFLVKVKKGVYRYDPTLVKKRKLDDFTPEQKKQIFRKDNYRCVQCGRGQNEGYELHADHRVPKDKGGNATVENGQTLCSVCNFRKKNYGQTESGKKMLIRLWEASIRIGDEKTKKFCEEVLGVYEKFNINGHIVWDKSA